MRKIYDCFTFFNELDLLDLRLSLLCEKVTKFILVESKKSHSGEDKTLYFQENKDLFSKYLSKITHIIVDDFPEEMIYTPSESDVDPSLHIHWFRENYQRNEILKGLYSLDLDENEINDLVELFDENDVFPYPDYQEDDEDDDYYGGDFDDYNEDDDY